MIAYPPPFHHQHPAPPFACKLLEDLPQLHHQPFNHSQVIQHLRMILQCWPSQAKMYNSTISNYLFKNIELNVKILQTMDCLVFFHSHISIPVRESISNLLQEKYPCMSFNQEIRKLEAINQSLVEPFMCLLGKIEAWYQLQIQKRQYKYLNLSQFDFLLEFLYTMSKYQFDQESQLEGKDLSQCFLTIYRVIFEDHYQMSMVFDDQSYKSKLSLSIFYFLVNFQMIQPLETQAIFSAIRQIIGFLQYQQFCFQSHIFKQILIVVRKRAADPVKNHSCLVSQLQSVITSILTLDWSLDKELQWSWKSKILWDLLGVSENSQVELIKELQTNSQDLRKCIKIS